MQCLTCHSLKVNRCIELNDLMNLHEYQRSRSFYEFSPNVTQFSKFNPFFFSSKAVELFETKYTVKEFGSTEMSIYTNGLVT